LHEALWTLNKELCNNVEAFETQCYRRAMRNSYVEHVTNEEVLRRVGQDSGLLGQVKSRKLKYFGHTTRHESLEKDIMLGIMPGKRRQDVRRNNGSMILFSGATGAWSKW